MMDRQAFAVLTTGLVILAAAPAHAQGPDTLLRDGTRAGRGAFIGGIVGATLLGTWFGEACQLREGCTNRGVAILAGAVAGAVPGGLLGALIGLRFPSGSVGYRDR